ncbi:phosphatase PAP2 family protein [Dysgonomonas sp. 511]|uniref:phosphatase PAP2 family protein n=1 Tax=Dysgonomonas sp. 511 TaxID=2302930 RepID=UPI0013D57A15|nr:phosphatase PAP2 family protein [Dysgonomonas sp. 511]NDV78051.1 phosphatase PAP2 family protein [Dysgonomonas sp. 511]
MLEEIIEWDKELFLFLNGKHTDWLDPVMLVLSSYWNWIVVCLIIIVMIFFKGRVKNILATLFFLFSVGVSAFITNLVKFIVQRPRPIHSYWDSAIHAIEKDSDSYSFFSSHSATAFAMSVFFLLFYRVNKVYGWIALVWATLVAYSRIYVAKHYPLDVICGIICGVVIGVAGYKVFAHYEEKEREFLARSPYDNDEYFCKKDINNTNK